MDQHDRPRGFWTRAFTLDDDPLNMLMRLAVAVFLVIAAVIYFANGGH